MDKASKKRWNAQAASILARLLMGSASNRELATMALSYTRRISDLREEGHQIECKRHGGGVTFYHLQGG